MAEMTEVKRPQTSKSSAGGRSVAEEESCGRSPAGRKEVDWLFAGIGDCLAGGIHLCIRRVPHVIEGDQFWLPAPTFRCGGQRRGRRLG